MHHQGPVHIVLEQAGNQVVKPALLLAHDGVAVPAGDLLPRGVISLSAEFSSLSDQMPL